MKFVTHRAVEISAICMLAAIVAACSTSGSTPVPPSKAAPVSQQRVFAPVTWLHPCKDCGKIIVTRGNGTIRGVLFNIAVWADHTLVATLRPGTKAAFYLPAGHHELAIANGKHGRPNPSETLPVMLQAGATKVYQIEVSGGLGFVATFTLSPYKNADKSPAH